MILTKRIHFVTRCRDLGPEEFAPAWRDQLTESLDAPDDARPLRIATCLSLPAVTPDPRHDGIGLEWFADHHHLARYEAWLARRPGRRDGTIDVDNSHVVIATEHVMRGEDWLEARWRDGGAKLKHMAIARRARGLTLNEFFDLWRSRAGKVGTAVIPDVARGLAYVQNRPLPDTADWAYDALNEVYFDDPGGLQARIDYFQETLADQTEDDLVSESWFIAAEEEPV